LVLTLAATLAWVVVVMLSTRAVLDLHCEHRERMDLKVAMEHCMTRREHDHDRLRWGKSEYNYLKG
jgi:hypothetical protein